MQQQTTKKPSGVTNAACISAIFILFYEIFISFIGVFLIVTEAHHCDRQDYGACALQNMFVDLFGFFAALIFGLALPVGLILMNVILIVAGWRRNDGWKKLLVASSAVDVLSLLLLCLLWAFVMFFSRN